jgi:uncharacterized damage-inducible protein DinB
MMPVEQYRALARYNRWMNTRLYELCAGLSEEERTRDLGAFFHSIHGTLNHLLLADRAWLGRFTGDPAIWQSRDRDGHEIKVQGLDQILYADFDTLRAERTKTDADLEAWVETLTGARLQRDLVYRSSDGREHRHPLWIAATHLFNHQTHHRGQVTTLLMQLGHDPGLTDFAIVMREGLA